MIPNEVVGVAPPRSALGALHSLLKTFPDCHSEERNDEESAVFLDS